MTQEERLNKTIEEVQSKLGEGWSIRALSTYRFTEEGTGDKVMYLELELVEAQ